MKIATFNINGINKRLDNLLDWLAEARPDIVCLQELKAAQDAFPEEAIAAAGYDAVWVGQKSWNGVAILSRIGEPVVTRRSLPVDPADEQARYIEAAVAGVLVASIYAPNGNPQPGAKFAYKLAWLERLRDHATTLRKSGAPIVLSGDYNVAPTDLDIYPTSSWDDDALIHPESRAASSPPGQARLHLLALQAHALATRCRAQARSPATQPQSCRQARRIRCRP
jgi:exodeoxyribonuclease III